MTIVKRDQLWRHTERRIIAAEEKAKSNEEFVKKMITRMNRITHQEKIHYAIEVLKERGHNNVVDIYEGRLVMDEFLKGINNI